MAATNRSETDPPVGEITVRRDRSGWIIVQLDGETVWRRLTRDKAFTRAWVGFSPNQSPYKPKSRINFNTVVLGGSWRPSGPGAFATRNSVEVQMPVWGESVTYVGEGEGSTRVYRKPYVPPPMPAGRTIPWSELASFDADEDPWPPF